MKKSIKIILWIILIGSSIIFAGYRMGWKQKIKTFFYPIQYEQYVSVYAEELEIDPLLIYSIIKIESNFNANAESRSGAVGLMQLMENTAKEQAEKLGISYAKELLYQPDVNLKLGLHYFKTLLDYFNQNEVLAFAAYNAGIGNVNKWIKEGIIMQDGSNIENIPFQETNLYVRKIIKTYAIYKELYQ